MIQRHFVTFFAFVFITIATVFFIQEYCKIFNLLDSFAKNRSQNQPLYFFIMAPLFFWVSAFICRKYAIYAAGNSIEHFEESLELAKKSPANFSKISDLLGVKVIIIKTISSLFCVFGGGTLGREGPSVHMSAGIFAVFADKVKKFLPKIDFTTWIISGSAVGMAVAFHAPIAGFTFAVEKILRNKIPDLFAKAAWVLCAILVVVLVLYPYKSIVEAENVSFKFQDIYASIAIAISCAAIAFFFKKANKYFYNKFAAIKSKWWHLVPIFAGLIVASISLYCGIYSFGGGIYTVDAVLNSDVLISAQQVTGRILNTIISFISGCAGGLIAPAIAIGAGIGSVIGSLTSNVDVTIFVLVGMTAFLTAILREPITAVMIIFEISNQSLKDILPLFFVAIATLYVMKFVEIFEKKLSN